MLSFILMIVLSYLAGSIPTAIIVSRIVLKDDIRNHGSKNAGATNVYRVMGWKPALIVSLVDIGKGMAATLLISKSGMGVVAVDPVLIQLIAGFSAILGHIFTLFAGFKGGKGVWTAFGVVVGLIPVAALSALGVWIIVVAVSRIVSLASMIAAVSVPVILFLQRNMLNQHVSMILIWTGVVLAALILFTHRANIGRLMRGEENKFGSKKKDAK